MASGRKPVDPAYEPPSWLRGQHLQTILPSTVLGARARPYRRERWDTPDDDFIDLDWVDSSQPHAPLVVLFHGLEGSSRSHYAGNFMREVAQRDWRGVVPHFRGCSGVPNRAPRFYHSGDSAEVNWILGRLHAQYPGNPMHVVGVSLGGNALLRWLGERGDDACKWVVSAAAISAPLDLAAGGRALSRGFNRLYTKVFLDTLKPKCDHKLLQYPGLFDAHLMRAARNLYEFDNVVTAPLHGYRDTDDYWHRASAKWVLPAVRVPTLILNACNDPFLPESALPRSCAVSSAVRLEYPTQGGHVGFYDRGLGSGWLACRTLDFLEHGQ
jgi:predicted alpha/beta-fold hydrolase